MSLEMTADRIFFSVGVSGRNRMAAMPHRFAAAAVLAAVLATGATAARATRDAAAAPPPKFRPRLKPPRSRCIVCPC
ncbi:hypothetical protein [Burkholderia ambifaria]|uniref:hypothetical protein n=1 Tax=Burkholderia ambifaria TaxID=152480 RepID=UPI00158B75AC|nr:hypothetical protein [Burkholderia ambifaria]